MQEVLSGDPELNRASWLKRRQEAQAKLGSALGLAEILRDGANREDPRLQRSRLSPSERELLSRARELLSNEIALARGIEPAEASGWIDAQLSPRASSVATDAQ